MRIEEVVYKGRDNITALALYANGLIMDHSTITRVALVMSGGLTLDSQLAPQLFNLTLVDKIELKLGLFPKIIKGIYGAQLVVYSTANTEGIVWGVINLTIV